METAKMRRERERESRERESGELEVELYEKIRMCFVQCIINVCIIIGQVSSDSGHPSHNTNAHASDDRDTGSEL